MAQETLNGRIIRTGTFLSKVPPNTTWTDGYKDVTVTKIVDEFVFYKGDNIHEHWLTHRAFQCRYKQVLGEARKEYTFQKNSAMTKPNLSSEDDDDGFVINFINGG